MTRSSPSRRDQYLTGSERQWLSHFLQENRNDEISHRDALAAAQAEHERVRDAAIRVYQLHERQEEHQRLVEAQHREQERLRVEAEIAEEHRRVEELRRRSIPKPAPPPPPPKEPEPAPPPPAARTEPPPAAPQPPPAQQSAPTQPRTQSSQEPKRAEPSPFPPKLPVTSAPQPQGMPPAQSQASQPKPSLFSPQAPASQAGPAALPNGVAAAQPATPVPQSQTAAAVPGARLLEIHKELKKLRTNLQAAARQPGSPLKGKMGEFRREIRVSIGQLTSGRGANAQPINRILSTLRSALEGKVSSPPVEVSLFVVEQRQPVEGAYNDATLPSLFIYLLNICAKGIINQFINEAAANTKAADPIGVFAANIFSQTGFLWRGQPLIDILIAKFRVVCPVLFGCRGNDKMEKGRLALGWRRDGPAWITEQSHNDRMTGLGAGYASISLRDFSRSSKANPYPPTHYWEALAAILNTPAGETSNTQYVVLRAMIEGYEQRFINFYGNAAIAALRLALVEFPKRAPQNALAAGSLQALAELLRSEKGLPLA